MSETVWLGIEQRKWLEAHPYLADEDDVRRLLANTTRLEKEISSFDGSVMPEPGAVCPACGERKPSEAALKMREWRAKRR